MANSTKTILLVEDEEIIALEKTKQLGQAGYNVIHSLTGEAAIEIVNTNPGEIDLILMDIQLGEGIDGTETAQQILRTNKIPIIFLSAHTEPEIVHRTENITNYGYIGKFSSFTVLEASIKMAFKLFDLTRQIDLSNREIEVKNQKLQVSLETLQKTHDKLVLSEDKFSKAFHLNPESIIINRLIDGVYLDINEGFTHIMGYTREDVIGYSSFPSDLGVWVHSEDREKLIQGLNEKGEVISLEAEFRKKDGTIAIGLLSAHIIEMNGEKCIISIMRDITDRKHQEVVLRQSEQKYQNLVQNINDVVFSLDVSGNITFINDVIENVSGYSASEVIGSSFTKFIYPDDLSSLAEAFAQNLSGINVGDSEYRVMPKSGDIRHVRSSSKVVSENGVPIGVTGIIVDITEQKKAKEALQAKQRQLSEIIDFLPDATFAIDKEGRVIIWNKAIENMTGVPAAEMIGKSDYAYAIPFYGEARPQLIDFVLKDFDEIPNRYSKIIHEDRTFSTEVFCNALYNKRGAWVYAKSSPLHDTDGDIVGAIESIRDINEQKHAEEALKESEEKYRGITEQSADGIVVLDANGTIVEWNKAQEEIVGLRKNEVLGLSALKVIFWLVPNDLIIWGNSPQLQKIMNDFLQGNTNTSNKTIEQTIILPDGSTKYISAHFFVIKNSSGNMLVGIFNDRTEQKRMEKNKLLVDEYLQHTQRLESLGVLAGGIAHDFNNILTGLFGFTDLAKSRVKDEVVSEYLSNVMDNMERAKGLTQQLLTFSKGGNPVKKITSISSLVKRTCDFTIHGTNIKLQSSFPGNLWHCNVDKEQIEQVIQNLMINAIQAMPNGGVIEVNTRNLTLKENEHPTLKTGNYVIISIKDHGIGIQQEMLSKIFDPFFTTKEQGHGLGLAISHSIITKHDGAINVASEFGKGTLFTIYLPASDEYLMESAENAVNLHVGVGKILVMDDNEQVQKLISLMLQSFGYSVIAKSNGKDAIACFKEDFETIKTFTAVILDLTVQGELGGKEVVENLRKMDKQIPIFVASGYAEDQIVAHPQDFGFTASIKKPFSRVELMEVLGKYMK
ncbi:MAG: PAS domain S-box protein [Rectinemataceae bacterium]|jgi:PAS domain S-box-containing protein